MFLAELDTDYKFTEFVREGATQEEYEQIRTRLPILGLPDYDKRSAWWSNAVIVDENDVAACEELRIGYSLKKLKGVRSEKPVANIPQFAIISVPNIALYEVCEVAVLENACTDQLQNYLDEGWRILAVCPPNDQRRPDYVIGRTSKKARE